MKPKLALRGDTHFAATAQHRELELRTALADHGQHGWTDSRELRAATVAGPRAVESTEAMSESVQPTQSGPPAPPSGTTGPSGPSGPSSPFGRSGSAGPSGSSSSGRPGDAGATEDSVRRKLLMGAALLLALTSIYAGVFNVGRLAQIVLAAGATMAVVLALTSGSRRRNS
jgi:hypothetical protein